MRKALFMLAAMAVVAAVAGGGDAGAQTDTISEQDKTFLKGQQETNLAEVSLGKVVMERATSEAVKELATKLVADHQQVLELNKALHQKLGLTAPEETSAEMKAKGEEIKSKSGAAFDAAFVAAQIEGHTKSISSAQKEISSGSHPDVKAFATDYLPKAQMHLQHSQQTQSALSSGETAPTLAQTGTGTTVPLTSIGLALAALGLIARRWAT